MVVRVTVTDPIKLHATINSLRPPQKSDEVPKEVFCLVHNEVPVLTSADNIAPEIMIRSTSTDSLVTELTRPFTGLVLLAISPERTRLSIAMFPTEVTGLESGKTHSFAFFPAPLMKFLRVVKNSRVIMELQSERFVVMVHNDDTGSIKRKLQGNFAYVADGDAEDGRITFQTIPLTTGIRMSGEEMLQSLNMMDTSLVTMGVHSFNPGRKHAFTIACAGDIQFLISYVAPSSDQAVIDLREASVNKSEPEPYDEDLEFLKAQCDAAAAGHSVGDDFGETLLQNAREYLGKIGKHTAGAKKVRFDEKLGSFAISARNLEYKLLAHGLVQSKQLIGLLTDHARSLEQGLTVLFGHQQTTSYIVLAMPLAANGLVLHAVACSLAEDDL